jgi:DNA polymerase-3 subunit epsilon
MLGMEQTEGSCVGYQFGQCRGACIGKEPNLLHNARLQLALANLKARKWPFDGPIAIRERSWSGKVEWHVFDQWRHLGSVEQAEELEEMTRRDLPLFDYDVFRLLARVLKQDKLKIIPLYATIQAHASFREAQ